MSTLNTVRAEPVEALPSLFGISERIREAFDKLRPNGVGVR
jgi:hypothetical protein